MAVTENQVKVTKHSDKRIKFVKGSDTVSFFITSKTDVSASNSQITLSDSITNQTFDAKDVYIPKGNTTEEIVTNIRLVIES